MACVDPDSLEAFVPLLAALEPWDAASLALSARVRRAEQLDVGGLHHGRVLRRRIVPSGWAGRLSAQHLAVSCGR